MTKFFTVTVRESAPSYDWVLHMTAHDAADAVEKMLSFIRQRTKNMNTQTVIQSTENPHASPNP